MGDQIVDSVQKRFGKAVADCRHQAGLSQEELAEKADLDRAYISSVESGKRNPSLRVVEKLAQALGTPMADLLLMWLAFGILSTQMCAFLKFLDDNKLTENTIVMYSTDNAPHFNTWPDGGMVPFRSEKNSNWEGAYRVPCYVRWPGHIPARTVLNGIVAHDDWLPPSPPSRARRTSRRSSSRASISTAATTKTTLMATTSSTTSPARRKSLRATSSGM